MDQKLLLTLFNKWLTIAFLVSIIAMRGKEMLTLTELIAKDLIILKDCILGPVMIARLKFHITQLKGDYQEALPTWQVVKRKRGNQTIIKVLFEQSYALEEVSFVMGTQLVPPSDKNEGVETSFVFTDAEVLDFVTQINDPNKLHRGRNVLVPGLMLLDRLLQGQERINDLAIKGVIKFIRPLYTSQTYRIEENKIVNNWGVIVALLTLEEDE